MFYGKIRRTGNSLVVTVPKEEAESLGLREGDHVALDIRKADLRPQLRPAVLDIMDDEWDRHGEAMRYLSDH